MSIVFYIPICAHTQYRHIIYTHTQSMHTYTQPHKNLSKYISHMNRETHSYRNVYKHANIQNKFIKHMHAHTHYIFYT